MLHDRLSTVIMCIDHTHSRDLTVRIHYTYFLDLYFRFSLDTSTEQGYKVEAKVKAVFPM